MKRKKTIGKYILTLVIIATILPVAEAVNVEKINEDIYQVIEAKTLYVGGAGPNNYAKIQDAIDNASDGDTIYVYDESSPYYENLDIRSKGIKLIGENKYTTIIDGMQNGAVIFIKGDFVEISGFTIQNSSISYSQYSSGIYLARADYAKIYNNIIRYNERGISLWAYTRNYYPISCVNYNQILNNKIYDNTYGLYLQEAGDNTFYNNSIYQNKYGVYINDLSDDNIFYRNNFTDNAQNAFDTCLNIWFSRTLRCGNYWDDYTGEGWYNIGPKVNENLDKYPLESPDAETTSRDIRKSSTKSVLKDIVGQIMKNILFNRVFLKNLI